MADPRSTRRRRSNGEASRHRILDAASEIASERGYDGTSISAVSARCGLPASSIYWHFKDKDALIAAVIERSFGTWLAAVSLPDESAGGSLDRVIGMALQVAKALLDNPDFLRLGLMLALEHRPTEPSARRMFLQVRDITHQRIAHVIREFSPAMDSDSVQLLTTYAIATADGLFIARELGGDGVDLAQLFELHARTLFEAAQRIAPEEST